MQRDSASGAGVEPKHRLALLIVSVAAALAAAVILFLYLPRQKVKLTAETDSRTIRIFIDSRKIDPDEGACYVADLRRSVSGDGPLFLSSYVLYEDGAPLKSPGAVVDDIRKFGGGRYNFASPRKLFFSASDSTDPRRNGRVYELVRNEEFTRRKATFVADSATSSFAINVPKDCAARPIRLTWRNLDKQAILAPQMKARTRPNLGSNPAILQSILRPEMTPEQKAVTIWRFLTEWTYHFAPAEEGDECHDPVKLINVYGYGFCDDVAQAFASLCREARMKARTWGLEGHVVAEAWYENDWHMFDPDQRIFYRKPDGSIASVKYLTEHPELITRSERKPSSFKPEKLADLYTTTEDNGWFLYEAPCEHTISPELEPGDTVIFEFEGAKAWHSPLNAERGLPPRLGNGLHVRTLDVNALPGVGTKILVDGAWPYVFLNIKLGLEFKQRGVHTSMGISEKGQGWYMMNFTAANPKAQVFLKEWLESRKTGVYRYLLLLETIGFKSPADVLKSLSVTALFQFAPRSLPHVRPGKTTFDLTLVKPGMKLPEKFSGMEVVLEWAEVYH